MPNAQPDPPEGSKSLLPDESPLPLRWVLAGVATFVLLAATAGLLMRGTRPDANAPVASAQPDAEEVTPTAAALEEDVAVDTATPSELDALFNKPREPDPQLPSQDDEVGRAAIQEEQSQPLEDSVSVSVAPTGNEDLASDVGHVADGGAAQVQELADVSEGDSPSAEDSSSTQEADDAADVVITPASPGFLGLDEAERQIVILKELFEKRQLFVEIKREQAAIQEIARKMDTIRRKIAQLNAELRPAEEAYRLKLIEKRRVLSRNPAGVQTPVLDQELRMLISGIERIKREGAGEKSDWDRLSTDVKGNSERLNAMVRETRGIITEWVNASRPFGRLLDDSYRTLVDQATDWIGEEPQFPLSYVTRGFARAHLGEHEKAAEDFEALSKEFPLLTPLADAAQGYSLCLQGDLRRAAELFKQADRSSTEDALLEVFWASGLNAVGKPIDAGKHFKTALTLDQRAFVAHEGLALLWIQGAVPDALLDGHEAIEHAQNACELTEWGDWHSVNTLAMALAGNGDFGEAAKVLRQILPKTPRCRRAELQLRLQEYQAKVEKQVSLSP
jgi:tetratricopeptide (TPR) repeat protein